MNTDTDRHTCCCSSTSRGDTHGCSEGCRRFGQGEEHRRFRGGGIPDQSSKPS